MNKYSNVLLILTVFTFFLLNLQLLLSQEGLIEKNGPPNGFPIHVSDLLWKKKAELQELISRKTETIQSQTSTMKTTWGFTVGSSHTWYADDISNNFQRYPVPSTCRAVGVNCYIFVEDESWNREYVTQAEVDSVRIYFDLKTPADPTKGIFEMDTTAFGSPPDIDNDPRIIILLLDIKDGYGKGGGYVVGYFYAYDQYPHLPKSNAAEIFFIDTNPLNLKTEWGLEMGISTLAHEFQHMIHFNYDPDEETFINESFSTLAEVHCGFSIYDQSFYTSNTNQALFTWNYEDFGLVLADYARAARFGLYLRDQFGIKICKHIVKSPEIGVNGINSGLQSYGSSLRFNDILTNWFVANILNDRTIDTAYGYKYPHLPKASSTVFLDPYVNITRDTVKSYAVTYLSYKGGSHLKFNFTSLYGSAVVKAIEIGPFSKRVIDVPINAEFYEPEFGNSFYEIHFAIMNLNPNRNLAYSYRSTGYGGYEQSILSYSSYESGYILLPSSNQKLAMRFTPIVSGELYSVSFKLRSGLNSIKGDGLLKITVHQSIPGSISGIPGVQIGDSIVVPFRELLIGDWNEIGMRSAGVSINEGNDFQIVLEVLGTEGDTLQFLMDDGSLNINRTSSYRDGLNGLAWYNRADPNYGGGKAPSYENLLLESTVIYPADTMSRIPFEFMLSQNYPNPFNQFTFIDYKINKPAFVKIEVYDVLGCKVATLVNDQKPIGLHTVRFNASGLSSGIYFYRFAAGSNVMTKKMVFIK